MIDSIDCRLVKPVVMSTESCSRVQSGEQIWGKRWKSRSPFLPHACVYVLYRSCRRGSSCLTFPATHARVAAASSSVTGDTCCDLYPHPVMQSPSSHSVELLCAEFWKQRCFPPSLQECWKFPVLPNACARELWTVVGFFSRLLS